MAAWVPILVAAVALVEIARVLRDARRARRMNRAMHELRRPLQAIALGLESASPDLALVTNAASVSSIGCSLDSTFY